MSTTVKFLTYDEWVKEYPEVKELEEDCTICDGTGQEECITCGQDIECGVCGGTGIIHSAYQAYTDQLKRDQEAWAKYQTSLAVVS
jgi:RecJ-like exonuclease